MPGGLTAGRPLESSVVEFKLRGLTEGRAIFLVKLNGIILFTNNPCASLRARRRLPTHAFGGQGTARPAG